MFIIRAICGATNLKVPAYMERQSHSCQSFPKYTKSTIRPFKIKETHLKLRTQTNMYCPLEYMIENITMLLFTV
uniref:Uncharacterized protein n=1 Tax=Anguilla anguilla TaxID=7936 RepID=A0A0E9PLE6_ANGAN